MSNATELTQANFQELAGSGVALVDFWAEWCGPCKMMGPVIDELSAAYDSKACIAKVNVDNEQELAQKFSVSSIPTLVVLKEGEEVKRFVGVQSKNALAQALDEVLG